jgi:ATP-dependent RNA helicase DDX3X
MLENVKLCQYKYPTPIQSYCIPSILTGHDVVAVAQTGKLPNSDSFSSLLTLFRLGKDRCIPSPDPIQAHGQGPSAGCSAPKSRPLQPVNWPSPC